MGDRSAEIDDEDDAKETALEDYETEATRDEFVSVEFREIENVETAVGVDEQLREKSNEV